MSIVEAIVIGTKEASDAGQELALQMPFSSSDPLFFAMCGALGFGGTKLGRRVLTAAAIGFSGIVACGGSAPEVKVSPEPTPLVIPVESTVTATVRLEPSGTPSPSSTQEVTPVEKITMVKGAQVRYLSPSFLAQVTDMLEHSPLADSCQDEIKQGGLSFVEIPDVVRNAKQFSTAGYSQSGGITEIVISSSNAIGRVLWGAPDSGEGSILPESLKGLILQDPEGANRDIVYWNLVKTTAYVCLNGKVDITDSWKEVLKTLGLSPEGDIPIVNPTVTESGLAVDVEGKLKGDSRLAEGSMTQLQSAIASLYAAYDVAKQSKLFRNSQFQQALFGSMRTASNIFLHQTSEAKWKEIINMLAADGSNSHILWLGDYIKSKGQENGQNLNSNADQYETDILFQMLMWSQSASGVQPPLAPTPTPFN